MDFNKFNCVSERRLFMGLREDVKFIVDTQFEPKVPNERTILEQAKAQLRKGKSSGSPKLDLKAIKSLKEDEER